MYGHIIIKAMNFYRKDIKTLNHNNITDENNNIYDFLNTLFNSNQPINPNQSNNHNQQINQNQQINNTSGQPISGGNYQEYIYIKNIGKRQIRYYNYKWQKTTNLIILLFQFYNK